MIKKDQIIIYLFNIIMNQFQITLKKSRNFFSKNITIFLSRNSIKNILEFPKTKSPLYKLKCDNEKDNEKLLKELLVHIRKKVLELFLLIK